MLTVTVPAASKTYVVVNATSTNQDVKIVGAGPTTGVTLVAGEKAVIAWNGSDFIKVATSTADGVTTFSAGTTGFTPSTATSGAVTLAGTLATTNGGTGLTSFTANGVVYASSTSALATGSALTFDGTEFGFTRASAPFIRSTESSTGIISYFGSYAVGLYLGTTSNHPIQFIVNSSEQMRLTSTGLGIGTSSPSTKLTVHAGADGDVGFFRGGSTRQVQIGTSSTAGYINTDNGSAGLELRTQGTARAYLDNFGNLGLGVTPSVSSLASFQSTYGIFIGNSEAHTTKNAYYNAGWKYATTTTAARFAVGEGGSDFRFYTAPSGTAGNPISFTQAMTLDASGNLLVGTTTAIGRATVVGGTSQLAFHDGNGSNTNYGLLNYGGSSGELTLNANSTGGNTLIRFLTSSSGSNAERARITSGGNLLVGTTTDPGGSGKICDANGNVRAIPQSGSAKTTSYTLATTDVGEYIQVGSGGSITIPDATFATGDVVSVFNNTTGNITITCSITTAYIAGTDSDKATMTLATRGVATILFISSTVCVVTGNVT
jgi:hypothetical protein